MSIENKWIAVFRAGDYRGHGKGNWPVETLRAVADSYDPSFHEAPIVIDHKEEFGAFGWGAALKVEGDLLFARPRQVEPQFDEAVSAGRFKKRSCRFYFDLEGRGPYLRHISWLGGKPPQVKGLPDPEFREHADDANCVTVSFDEADLQNFDERSEPMSLTVEQVQKLIADSHKETDERLGRIEKQFADFSEEANKAIAALAETANAGKDAQAAQAAGGNKEVADFSEEIAQLRKDLAAAQAVGKAATDELTRNRMVSFCDGLVKEGRMLPHEAGGTVSTLLALDDAAATIDFSEGGKTEKVTARAQFMRTLARRPVIGPETRELAGGAGGGVDFAEKAAAEYYDTHAKDMKVSREWYLAQARAGRITPPGK